MSEGDLQRQLEQTSREVDRLRAENERLRTLLALGQRSPQIFTAAEQNGGAPTGASVATTSTPSEKIALIRGLFRGREDVYALRWESPRSGKSGYTPAVAGGWGGARDAPKRYLPLSDETIAKHLRGRESIGIYPLLKDDSCWLLACDLDGSAWQLDAMALLGACTDHDVPTVLERSRSGSGAHLWVFFSSPVTAASARRLGALLLREAMASRAELDLASYDRLFPSQDFLPQKGFGNLIALPLQRQMPTGRNERLPRPGDAGAGARSMGAAQLDRATVTGNARIPPRLARRRPGRSRGDHNARAERTGQTTPARSRLHDRSRPRDPEGKPSAAAARRTQAPRLAAQPALLRAPAAQALHPPDTATDPLLRRDAHPPAAAARSARTGRPRHKNSRKPARDR